MATATVGHMDKFDPATEDIEAYLKRVVLFFAANKTEKADQVVNVIGGKTYMYSLLRDLVAPAKPSARMMAQLKKTLKDHFTPKRVTIAECFYFYRRNQSVGETVVEYVAELRRLSTHCEFGDFLERTLRDRFVCGLCNEATQRKLLMESSVINFWDPCEDRPRGPYLTGILGPSFVKMGRGALSYQYFGSPCEDRPPSVRLYNN